MSSGRRGDQQYVIVKDDDGDRSYWASLRMKWPEVIDDETTARYWVSDLSVAYTYKTKVAAQRACPDIRRRGVTIITRGEAKLLDDRKPTGDRYTAPLPYQRKPEGKQ